MSDRELIRRAASLSYAAPDEWRAFIEALDDYVENVKIDMVNAPASDLAVQQGRARLGRDLLRLCINCTRTVDTMKPRER